MNRRSFLKLIAMTVVAPRVPIEFANKTAFFYYQGVPIHYVRCLDYVKKGDILVWNQDRTAVKKYA
jgi:hypothetical protein